MLSAHERVTREDLVTFINACFSYTGQREFYAQTLQQRLSIRFLHEYILGNYRKLYARTLALGINHYNQAEIIVRLLASGKKSPSDLRHEEGQLIATALSTLPTHRAYHVLEELAKQRVNNRRTRAIVREFFNHRTALEFESVKYRRSARAAAAHVHLPMSNEIGTFLFHGANHKHYQSPLFASFRKAHFSKEAIYQLPFTIAEGLAQKHKIDRSIFLKNIEPRLTERERVRLQATSQRELKQAYEVDLSKTSLTQLALYILSFDSKTREQRHDELTLALQNSAAYAIRQTGVRYGKVAAVLDRSYSASGSYEKRRRPLAVALATSVFLRLASEEYRAFWTVPIEDELFVTARGSTNLADPILDAIDWGAELIVVISDGYENDPPMGVAQLAPLLSKQFGKHLIVHLNPVFDHEYFSSRSLAKEISTMGIRDAEDLPTLLGFARFAAGQASLQELENYTETRVKAWVNKTRFIQNYDGEIR